MHDRIRILTARLAEYDAAGDLEGRDFVGDQLRDALEELEIAMLADITDFDRWLACCLLRPDSRQREG